MLVTSGLRVDELCQLRWKYIEYYNEEQRWTDNVKKIREKH